MKKILFLILNICAINIFGHSQTPKYHDYNLIKKISFNSKGKFYPLTLSICPYYYWQFSEIAIGFNNKWVNDETTYNVSIIDSIIIPKNYIYDTTKIDTVYSLFSTIMCDHDAAKNHELLMDENITGKDNSINYMQLVLEKEVEYTFLLKDIEYPNEGDRIIRCVYPLIVYPYKASYVVSDIILLDGSIKIMSRILNTTNIFNIYTEKKVNSYLKKNDSKRFLRRLNKTSFSEKIDCNFCNHQPYADFDIVIEYLDNGVKKSFFLCDFVIEKSMLDNETYSFLIGMKSYIYFLNSKYFGIKRRK
jgi:hypothetical protein